MSRDSEELRAFIEAKNLIVDIGDFILGDEINRGGYGVVYKATRRSDGGKVAIKFFGYTANRPDWLWLRKEIEILEKLRHVRGVASLECVVYDTPRGVLPRKAFLQVYPAIVMERMEGGDLCDRIMRLMNAGGITEHHGSQIFKNFIVSLQEVHSHSRLINCDLKADNIVFVGSEADDLRVKIIDFGLALDMDEHNEAISRSTRGTTGYIAPETLQSLPGEFRFSAKTDIFQAGCVLFMLLCARLPFGNTERENKEILRKPIPELLRIKGLSAEAKDLIYKLLEVNPINRITIAQVLEHPWIVNGEGFSSHDLGPEYRRRVKGWVYRKKLKAAMHDRIIRSEKHKRALLSIADDLHRNYMSIKPEMFNALKKAFNARADPDTFRVSKEGYFEVINDVGISWLNGESVYEIFDENSDNSIDYLEFIVSLTPFRCEYNTTTDPAELYFDMFDMNADGSISRSEFDSSLRMFLLDGIESAAVHSDEDLAEVVVTSAAAAVVAREHHDAIVRVMDALDGNVDELFAAVDSNGDGLISRTEFSNFFRVVNTNHSTIA